MNHAPNYILGVAHVAPATQAVPLPMVGETGQNAARAHLCPNGPGKGILPPAVRRRLGPAQELGLLAAVRAAAIAPASSLDSRAAVFVGTAWGELGNTANFLKDMVSPENLVPRPAFFVSSVHNAIAAQIAIHLGLAGANHTFTHGAISFETALEGAMRNLRLGRSSQVLVCGVDKIEPFVLSAGLHARGWQDGSGELPGVPAPCLPGEGAAAFVLAAQPTPAMPSVPRLRLCKACPLPNGGQAAREEAMAALLAEALERTGPVDLLVTGARGLEAGEEAAYEAAQAFIASRQPAAPGRASYRAYTGDFPTASAIALALSVASLNAQAPVAGLTLTAPPPGPTRRVLVYHHLTEGYQSVCVLDA